MRREVIGICPVCQDELHVKKLGCNNCKTTIEGEFFLNKFSKLSTDQIGFLDVFIKNRGNIKEIEKELGISYPTVKNRLEDLIEALGYSPKYNDVNIDKKEILRQLDAGEITSEEAIKLMKG